MANKFYQAEKTINGTKYVAQFNGISAALRMMDSSYIDGTNNTSLEKLTKYLLTNVIVEPANLTVDDFDNFDELNEVIGFAREVMQGEFRGKSNVESETKGKSKQ